MGFFDSIIDALTNNHASFDKAAVSRLSDVVKMTFMASYNSNKQRKKENEMSNDNNTSSTVLDMDNGEEARNINVDFATRISVYIGSLTNLENRNENEIRLTEECLKLYELTKIKNTTQEKKDEILARLKQKYSELLIARKRYDKSMEIFKTCMVPHKAEDLRKKYSKYRS